MNLARPPRSPRSPGGSSLSFGPQQQQTQHAPPRRPSPIPRCSSSPTLPSFRALTLGPSTTSNPNHQSATSPLPTPSPTSNSNNGFPFDHRSSAHLAQRPRPPLLLRRQTTMTTAGKFLPSSTRTSSPSSPVNSTLRGGATATGRRPSLTNSVVSLSSSLEGSAGGSTGGGAGGGPVPPSLLLKGRWPSSFNDSTSNEAVGGAGSIKIAGWRKDVQAQHHSHPHHRPSPFSMHISPPIPSTSTAKSSSASGLSRTSSLGSSSTSSSLSVGRGPIGASSDAGRFSLFFS
ncbi:hypothetical protein BDY24DRAFT_189342 [Mrakia frigida]|uniref:uncharacterized protein n=1 Tax=Mrakia frigida TaxID=29902 RepID=UPI003FCBEE78